MLPQKRAATVGHTEIPQIFLGRFFKRRADPSQLVVKVRLG
jgi:hypothetical protein